MPNELRLAALAYSASWLSVIPVQVRGKLPLVQWGEFQARIASEKEVKEWWRNWPDANVGIVTGAISGIVVIDIDAQDAGTRLREQFEIDFKSTPRVKTGKGWHLYFRHPYTGVGHGEVGRGAARQGEVIQNRAGILPGLDVRGDGGYVLTAPSIHPNGNRYAWEVAMTESLPLMPPALYELIKSPPIFSRKDRFDSTIVWEGIPEGQRDEQVFKYASQLRAWAVPEADAQTLVLAVAAKCVPPFSESEALAKLRQVYTRYREGTGRRVQEAQSGQGEIWPDMISAKAVIEHIDTTRWIWREAIPVGGVAMIAGQPRAGKSTLALNLALAISRGAEFLRRPTEKLRTAYISVDNSVAEMKNIANGLGMRETDDILFHVGQVPEQASAWLFDMIAKTNCKFIVIDTFQRFLRVEEINDSAAVTAAMGPINHEAERAGCAVLWVHHSGKSESGGALGSISIKAMAPYFFELKREDGARILTSDQRGGKNFEGAYIKIEGSGWNAIVGNRGDALVERAGQKVMDALRSEPGLTEGEIYGLVEARKESVSRAIRLLLKSGHIQREGTPHSKTNPFRYFAAAELNSIYPLNQSIINQSDMRLDIKSHISSSYSYKENGTQHLIGINSEKAVKKQDDMLGPIGEGMQVLEKQGVMLGPANPGGNTGVFGNKRELSGTNKRPLICGTCCIPMVETETEVVCEKCEKRHLRQNVTNAGG